MPKALSELPESEPASDMVSSTGERNIVFSQLNAFHSLRDMSPGNGLYDPLSVSPGASSRMLTPCLTPASRNRCGAFLVSAYVGGLSNRL